LCIFDLFGGIAKACYNLGSKILLKFYSFAILGFKKSKNNDEKYRKAPNKTSQVDGWILY